MNHARRWKPFWRWEAFLFAMVLVLAMAASFVVRVDWPVVGAVLGIVLLVAAVTLAALLVVPILLVKGRDSENTRKTLEGVELVEPTAENVRTLRVVESERRQSSIEAARAKSREPFRAVLTPDASRWLGRQLRVAVDLLGDDGSIYRAGFVPPEVDAELDARLRPYTRSKRAVVVPAAVIGSARPFRVEFRLGDLAD